MEQWCCLSCCTSQLYAEGQRIEAHQEDLVGQSNFVVYGLPILDPEFFAVRHARGCVGCLARLTSSDQQSARDFGIEFYPIPLATCWWVQHTDPVHLVGQNNEYTGSIKCL